MAYPTRPGLGARKGPPFRTPIRSSFGIDLTPVVLSINPNSDRIAGGAIVTILGQQFVSGMTVAFGGVVSPGVSLVSPNELTVVVPQVTTTGIVDVTVTAGTQTGTLADAFLYYAGHIDSVTPNYSLVTGGITVRIAGINFLTGSTVSFGGSASPSVTFVDSTLLIVQVPAHSGAGPVDVVITEPTSLVTVTGAGLFLYTSIIPQQDIRRQPSITVLDALNNAPNTAAFTVDGKSSPPSPGTGVEFTDNGVLIFSGSAQSIEQTFKGRPENIEWNVVATDRTFLFNRRRPFGTYNNQRANDVVIDLVNRFAPDFTTEFVQTDLARVSVVFDGSADMQTCLSQLAQMLGEGHWYVDYYWRVHFFHIPPLTFDFGQDPLAPISLGPGNGMTVTESAQPITGYFPPGYYYFRTTSLYGTVPTYGTPLVSAPSNYVLLSNEAAALNLTGVVQNGTYSDGVSVFPRGWAGYNGVTYITGTKPAPGGNIVYFASQDIATLLEQQALQQFESAFSPISNIILLQHYRPTFSSIPIAPAIGSNSAYARRIFFTRLGDFHTVGGTRTTGYLEIADNATTSITAEPTIFYDVPTLPNVAHPTFPTGTPAVVESPVLVDHAAFLGSDTQPGYYAFAVSCVYKDGTESIASIPSNVVFLSGPYQARMTAIPVGADVNGVSVEFRKIYASIVTPYYPPVAGTPDFTAGNTNLVAIIPNNTNTGPFDFPTGSGLSGGDGDPNLPVGLPIGARTVTGNVDGPFLEDTDAPADVTDTNPDLLMEPALKVTADISQLRNRVYVKGKGTIVVEDAPLGQSFIKVADVGMFAPSGGLTILGSRVLPYVSLQAAAGQGQIMLAAPLTQPVLQADWKFGGGTPIRPFVQVDDVRSQRERGLVELDKNGQPTDGVHEFTIDDDSLSDTYQCISRGLAELQLFSRPITRVQYATRDPLTRSGKLVHFDVNTPRVTGDFIIQEVVIDQFHDKNDQLAPRYNVTADSAARFNFNDLILYLDDRSSKGVGSGTHGTSLSSIVNTSTMVIRVDPNGPAILKPTIRWVAWTEFSSQAFGTSASPPSYVSFGWTAGIALNGTQTAVLDTEGQWARATLTTSAGQEVRWQAENGQPHCRLNLHPRQQWKFRTGPNITNIRLWGVLTDGSMSNDDTNSAGRKGVGFCYSTSSFHTGFVTWYSTGGVPVFGTAPGQPPIEPILPNTVYVATIDVDGDDVTIYINGSRQTFKVPASITAVGLYSLLNLKNSVDVAASEAKILDLAAIYGERD